MRRSHRLRPQLPSSKFYRCDGWADEDVGRDLLHMFDLYQTNSNDTARFILGKQGARKLIVVGLNPSTATRDKSDITATKVEKVARANGFDGFVMTNLYPLRATDPKHLPKRCNGKLYDDNLQIFAAALKEEKKPVVWAAWGGGIRLRSYLSRSFFSLDATVAASDGCWVHFGSLRKGGHPRHPSRLSYRWRFANFDSKVYSEALRGN